MNVGQSGQADLFSSTVAPQQLLCSQARRRGAPNRDPARTLGPLPFLPSSCQGQAPFHLFPPSLDVCSLTRTRPSLDATWARESGCLHGVLSGLASFVWACGDRDWGSGAISAGPGPVSSAVALTLAGFGTCGVMKDLLRHPAAPHPHTQSLWKQPQGQEG